MVGGFAGFVIIIVAVVLVVVVSIVAILLAALLIHFKRRPTGIFIIYVRARGKTIFRFDSFLCFIYFQ
jgi:hypothetical protein